MSENIPVNIIFNVKGNLTANFQKVKNAIGDVDKGLKTSAKSAGFFSEAMKTAAGVLIRDMVNGLTRSVSEMFTLGARVQALRSGFETLVKTTGGTTLSLEKLRKATKGTVSDVDLLKSANAALSLGLPTDDLDTLYAAALKLGRAMGIDTKMAVDSLSTGIGRQSKLILDNLGIVFKAEDAYTWYAQKLGVTASSLDETTKRLAWQSYAIEQVTVRAEALGEIEDTAITKQEQWSASIQNFLTRVGEVFSPLSQFKGAIEMLMPAMTVVAMQALPQLVSGIQGYISNAGGLVAAIMKVVAALYAKAAAGYAALAAMGPAGWAMIAAAIALTGVAVYALTRQTQGCADEAIGLMSAVERANIALDIHAETALEATAKLKELKTAEQDLKTELTDLQSEYVKNKEQLEKYIGKLERHLNVSAMTSRARAKDEANLKIYRDALADLIATTEDGITARESTLAVVNEEIESLERQIKVQTDFNILQAKSAENLDEVAQAWIEAFGAGKIEDATGVLEDFAAQCDISFSQAEGIVKDKSKSMIDEIEAQAKALQEAKDALSDFTSDLEHNWNLAAAAQDENIQAMATTFNYYFSSGMFKGAADTVRRLAEEYGISLKDAERVLRDFTAAQEAELEAQNQAIIEAQQVIDDMATTLEEKFNLMRASSDTNLGAIQEKFNQAFTAGNFDAATELIVDFAESYGISLKDAQKTIREFIQAQEEIPAAIEEILLQKAQGKFEEFKNCVSGKMFTMDTDVTGAMVDLAGNINDLIDAGLLGEAQDQIAAYAKCSSGKMYDMAADIEKTMSDLTEAHGEKMAEMAGTAAKLSGKEKDAVLNQMDLLTAEYETKMGNLAGWQEELYKKLSSPIGVPDVEVPVAIDAEEFNRSIDKLRKGIGIRLDGYPETTMTQGFQPITGVGGITQPVATLPGAREPEVFIPAKQFARPESNITIQMTVEGNVDKKTANYTVALLEQKLKNVLVEGSSVAAGDTHKKIRFADRMY